MTSRVVLEPLFVLHSRPYSNTSLIVECLSMRHGRIALLARSARGLKSRYKGKLQCFVPMLASWTGTRDLKNLGNVELCGAPYQLNAKILMCGFYLNELLMRLLHREDPYPQVFTLYQMTLNALEKGEALEIALRCFEKKLLQALGYGLSLTHEADTGAPINLAEYYQYFPEYGFVKSFADEDNPSIFSGDSLVNIEHESFQDEHTIKAAKRLMRMVLSHHIGHKPLKSRELMI